MAKIKVRHTSTVINDYLLGDCKELERKVSVWHKRTFSSTPYYTYDPIEKKLTIPRGVDVTFLEKRLNCKAEFDYEHDDFIKASFKLKVLPRDDIQRKALAFLVGENDFEYTKPHSQLSLNLTTGDGKTYCCIAAMTFWSMKTLIVTHKENIKSQWHESLLNFTTLDDSHICNIDGSKTMEKLLKLPQAKNKFKVYLVNHRTIHSYCEKHGWNSLQTVFEHLGIGLKIYDEAHKEFLNTCRMDQHTNTKKTFYVTANFEQSSHEENEVFNYCFSNVMKFGVETLKEKERHIVYMPYFFNSHPTIKECLHVKTRQGFSKNFYCDYHQENPMMTQICNDLVRSFIANNDERIAVLFSKISYVEKFTSQLKQLLPDESIGEVHSHLNSEEREKGMHARIIISTPASIGTGDHFENLRCLIMTEPYSSRITANQVSGRLRYLGNNKESYYIELVDTGFEVVYNMYLKRLKFFKKKCKKVLIMNQK